MGRSQRHKVYIQGYAADDEIVAEGMVAGTNGAAYPPPALFPFPAGTRKPTISSLSPNTAAAGAADLTMTVAGTNFVSGLTTIMIGLVDVATTFVSATSVTCLVKPTQFLAGVQQVKVRNGPYLSNEQPFTFT